MATHRMGETPPGENPPKVPRPDRDETLLERFRRWTDLDAVRWGAVGVVVVVIGLGVWWHSPAVVPEEVLPRASTSTVPAASAADADEPGASDDTPPPDEGGRVGDMAGGATVHVVGAVARPGLVTLEPGQRIADAIDLSGGPLEDADLHRLNLATVAVDGMRIEVPRLGDPVAAGALIDSPGADASGGAGSPPSLVDVNRADARELETLRGVGPATAAAIIEHRDAHGPFLDVESLLDVPGIGPAKLDALRDAVVAGR